MFTQPYYGSGFLYVDGHCNYYVSRGYVRGTGFGVVSVPEMESLQTAINWQSIGRIGLEPDVSSCTDGGDTWVSSPRAGFACDCECDGPNPEEMAAAIDQADYWITSTLWPTSPQLETPVRVAALYLNDDVAGTTQMWPLDQPIADYEGLVHQEGDSVVGVLFDDPADAAALRRARDGQNDDDDGLILQDGDAVYTVFIVDTLPQDVVQRIERFRNGNP
jgi:hypothetical protein